MRLQSCNSRKIGISNDSGVGGGGWGGDNFIGRPEFESRRVDIDAASLEELKDQQPGEPACMTSATK